MCTLLYLKWITHKDLLCSTGNSAQCYEPGCMGGESGGVYAACICVAESLYCSPETVTTLLTNYIPVQLSHSVVSNSLQSHGLQHTRLRCPLPAPRTYSNSCPLHCWCHPTISSCCPLLLLPSIITSIRIFSNESVLLIRWPVCWSFSFNTSPSNEHPGLISFRMDWLDLLAVQGTLESPPTP